MDAAHTRLCLLLHSLPNLDNDQLRLLLSHYGSVRALWETDAAGPPPGVSAAAWEDIGLARRHGQHPQALGDIERQLDALLGAGGQALALGDPGYPALLATIHDPPPLLYLRGQPEVLRQPQLAVVGSRKASPAGLRYARQLAAAAAAAGLVVTSGLALGIDGAAHYGAVEAGGGSVAVMATGVEEVYPRRHRQLALRLQQQGCLLSEFPPTTPPLPRHFPARNRIISGLSLGVLVVEAALPSGSLITAGTALEQGREVFAVPWFPEHRGGHGCLRLLRDGAVMVVSIEDILAELGALRQLQGELNLDAPRPQATVLSPDQRQLLDLVGFELVTVQELVHCSGRSVAQVLATLSALEAEGHVSRRGGAYLRC